MVVDCFIAVSYKQSKHLDFAKTTFSFFNLTEHSASPCNICINFHFLMSHLTFRLVRRRENYICVFFSRVSDKVHTAEYSICHTRQRNYCISDDEFLFSYIAVISVQ